MSSLSLPRKFRGEERETSKCASVTHHCERDVRATMPRTREGGGRVLPYKGLMGTCRQPGYVCRDFCLKQGIKFIIFCLHQAIDLSIFVLNKISLLGRFTAKFLQALVN